MNPTFNDWGPGSGLCLVCPTCQSEYTHHDRVDVYERHEDAETGIHCLAGSHGVFVDTSMAGNPSQRRTGVRINLWCEECHCVMGLTLIQHKGNTFLDLEIDEVATEQRRRDMLEWQDD